MPYIAIKSFSKDERTKRTPETLNAFVDKIVIHERVKQDGKRTQAVDIYYSYVGIVDVPTDEEMRAIEQEYMQRTNLQTA